MRIGGGRSTIEPIDREVFEMPKPAGFASTNSDVVRMGTTLKRSEIMPRRLPLNVRLPVIRQVWNMGPDCI